MVFALALTFVAGIVLTHRRADTKNTDNFFNIYPPLFASLNYEKVQTIKLNASLIPCNTHNNYPFFLYLVYRFTLRNSLYFFQLIYIIQFLKHEIIQAETVLSP